MENTLPIQTIVFIAIGLAMDAFAVSVSRGFCITRAHLAHASVLGLTFGFFQALMPQIGWLLGRGLEKQITSYDHWVAFVLLVVIGGKMIFEAIKNAKSGCDCTKDTQPLTLRLLLTLGVATSIDALTIGVTFSFLKVDIIIPILIIGLITFVMSFVGVFIGKACGKLIGAKAELLGGLILIGVATEILYSHLGN
jgi:manganese efflux pump family protein